MARPMLKTKLREELRNLWTKLAPRSEKNARVNRTLYDLWFFQEVGTWGDDNFKSLMKTSQDNGLIESDDVLRETKGDTIVLESDRFSFCTKVTEPSMRFDLETFIAKVGKKYKIPTAMLVKMAEASKIETKASLSKYVMEASS